MPGYSQSLCGNLNFHSPIGGVVLVVVDVAVAWIKLPHNALVASLQIAMYAASPRRQGPIKPSFIGVSVFNLNPHC